MTRAVTGTSSHPAWAEHRFKLASPASWAWGAIAAAAAILLLYAGRHLSFFFDEWDLIIGRRGESVGTYLDPHNGHLTLFPVVVYKLLLALVGLRHYWPYRVAEVALHLLCGWLLYVIARRRLGAWLALAPATLLLFLGSAYEDLLWPFQIGFLGSVAGGLGALAALERPSPRADRGACALLIWSLSASGVGVPFLLAAAAMLISQRAPRRRLWVVAVPAALFAIWYLGWSVPEHSSLDAVLGAPQYIADAATAATAAISGLSVTYGAPLAVVGGCAMARAVLLRPSVRTPLLAAAVTGTLTFWALSAVVRADTADPGSSRYLYIGAVFVLLLASELTIRPLPRNPGLALIGLLVISAVVANLNLLRSGERSFRATDQSVRVSLEAVELAKPVVARDFVAEPQRAPQVQAGPFLQAVRALGSPAVSLSGLQASPDSLRQDADGVLERAERLALTLVQAVAASGPLTVTASGAGRLLPRGRCATFVPSGPQDTLDLRVVLGNGLLIRPPAGGFVSVYLRRFAAQFSEPPFTKVTETGALRFPVDLAPQFPWHVRLTSVARFTVCGAS